MTNGRLLHHSASGQLDLFEEIIRLGRAGKSSALATVIECSGSSPRKAGARMLVRDDGSTAGSVGGGSVEQEVIAASMEVMGETAPRLLTFQLTEKFGHVCGGNMRIYIEPNTIEPRLVIIGAGHIGSSLAPLARFAGYHVTVIDQREGYACSERLPEANETIAATGAEALEQLKVGPSTQIVIATTDFQQDFDAVRAALKTKAGFIGMIGSRRKRAALEEALQQEGYGDEQISRVFVPVGLKIGAETPQEIAVSIMAQLIASRRGYGA